MLVPDAKQCQRGQEQRLGPAPDLVAEATGDVVDPS